MADAFAQGGKVMEADAGHVIALNIILLYTILGPLVLLAIYVLFDSLAKPGGMESGRQDAEAEIKDPAVWTGEDINEHMNRT